MFSIDDILQATQGKLLQGNSETEVTGISTDTRSLLPGNLFIALKGPNFDGHFFIDSAVGKLASALLVSDQKISFPKNFPVIIVQDTTKALGQIALSHRRRFSIPIIAITGSAGKTSTKEMLATVLGRRFRVLKNVATENNHIGVPSTLLKLSSEFDVAVIEFGTNRFGDIAWLKKITEPTIAVLTNVGESHLELLKTPAGVFKEKSEIFKTKPLPEVVLYNSDDRFLKKISLSKNSIKKVSYAIDSNADYRAQSIVVKENSRLNFKVNDRRDFELNSPAYHNIYNSLVSIACADYFQMKEEDIRTGIKASLPAKGRQSLHQTNRFLVIDDTYNANPVSVRSALKTLTNLEMPGRKIFICGDMLELGRQSKVLHQKIGRLAGELGMDAVFSVGELSEWISQAAHQEARTLTASHSSTIEELHQRLRRFCQPGDVFLVKGSRRMKMERTVAFLLDDSWPALKDSPKGKAQTCSIT